MFRAAVLILWSTSLYAAQSAVDIETAAKLYQEAAIREQVRASLGAMPAHIRQLFSADPAAKLTEEQLNAVTAAAKRGFRIDVFEVPALSALAQNLDEAALKKTEAFLAGDLGRRMVEADLVESQLDESKIDQIMNGELSVPVSRERDALFDKLEHASRSSESTVQIFLSMGQAVAIGTAVGAGRDSSEVAESARKSGDASRAELERSMREPLHRYMAYGYRDLSDADLKHILAFMESPAGKRYVSAYIASLGAGFDAMGRRTGEQLGEALRELAQAQFDVPTVASPAIAAPAPAQHAAPDKQPF
jgi:predicted DNA binding protein